MVALPRFYPILDAGLLARAGIALDAFAHELRAAGVRWLQYRDKDAEDARVLERAAMLRRVFPAADSRLILNDRAHLLTQTGFEGVHVGQEDATPDAVRALLGTATILGVSTHNEEQLRRAEQTTADYVAIGPVFATQSKAVPDPVVGLAGVRAARALTTRPLVAIGGITLANSPAVLAAGADSVAILSALLPGPGASTQSIAAQFLAALSA